MERFGVAETLENVHLTAKLSFETTPGSSGAGSILSASAGATADAACATGPCLAPGCANADRTCLVLHDPQRATFL